MGADLPEVGVLAHPPIAAAPFSRSWWRDSRLWTAIGSTMLLKLGILWLVVAPAQRLAQVRQTRADLRSWSEFFKAVRAGGTPYVDVPSTASVLSGSWHWLLAELPGWSSIGSIRPA